MKRTTIYLEPELEVLLKLEAARRKQPVAELIRDAVRSHFTAVAEDPPGLGAFKSRHRDTADDVDAALADLGFGESTK